MALVHPEIKKVAEVIPLNARAEKVQAALDCLPSPEGLYRSVPTYLLNRFGQQREGHNEVQGELDKSIRNLGVLEPILVSVMTAEELAAYIEFTNKTWGGVVRLDDCVPFAAEDTDSPLFLALVGGHSRVSAVEQIALAAGQACDEHIRIDAHIIPVESAVDYAVKQAAENIHSRPSPYRTIRLVASAYLFRASQGEKVSRRAFAREMSISEQTLRDALNYAELPAEIRHHTDKGLIPIGVSIELARALPVIRRECAWRVSKNYGISEPHAWTPEAEEAFTTLLNLELFRHITAHNNATNKGRNVVTRAQIRLHAKHARKKLGEIEATSEALEMNLFDARDFIDMDIEARRTSLRQAIEENLRQFASERKLAARKLHNLVCASFDFEGLGVEEDQEDTDISLGTAAMAMTFS